MMREEFAWIAFWLWFSLLTKRGGNRSTKTVDEVKYYRKMASNNLRNLMENAFLQVTKEN